MLEFEVAGEKRSDHDRSRYVCQDSMKTERSRCRFDHNWNKALRCHLEENKSIDEEVRDAESGSWKRESKPRSETGVSHRGSESEEWEREERESEENVAPTFFPCHPNGKPPSPSQLVQLFGLVARSFVTQDQWKKTAPADHRPWINAHIGVRLWSISTVDSASPGSSGPF